MATCSRSSLMCDVGDVNADDLRMILLLFDSSAFSLKWIRPNNQPMNKVIELPPPRHFGGGGTIVHRHLEPKSPICNVHLERNYPRFSLKSPFFSRERRSFFKSIGTWWMLLLSDPTTMQPAVTTLVVIMPPPKAKRFIA